MITRNRITRFDNLKGFLIIMVVFIHALMHKGFVQNNVFPLSTNIEIMINSFAMPTFVFLSGLFTSKRTQEGYAEKIVFDIFIPFVVFHLLQWAIFSHSLKTVLNPFHHMWYLLSLFFWRLLIVHVSKIRFSLLISIAVALICGFTPADHLLSVSRTICFFPYFLAGYYTNKEIILKFGNCLKRKIFAGGGMIILFSAVIILQYKGLPIFSVFLMNGGYGSLGVSNITGLILRALAYCISSILIFCLLHLSIDKDCFLSTLGRNTMPIYIGHAIIIKVNAKILRMTGIFSEISEIGFIVFAIIDTSAICLLLSNRYVVSLYQRLMGLITKSIVKNEQTQSDHI